MERTIRRWPPLLYFYGEGSGESTITTDLWSFFIQDDFRPLPTLTINVGLRYDLDTDGNNPDFTSPLQPEARGRDTNNWQPRAGFSWDVTGTGRHVVRGGVGLFTGRYLLIPAHGELQQNSYTGWIIQQPRERCGFRPPDRSQQPEEHRLPPSEGRHAYR